MARWKDKKAYEADGSPRINPHKQKQYDTSFAEVAERLKATGATEADIAFLLGTSHENFREWKRNNPDLKRALKRGKQLTRTHLIAKGIKAAGGYTIKDRTIEYVGKMDADGRIIGIQKDDDGNELVKVKETEKEVPVNDRMLMFLVSALDRQLGNEDWVHRQFVDKREEKTINLKVNAESVADQIDKLGGKLTKYIESKEVEVEQSLIENER